MTCDVKLWRDEAWDLRVTLGRHCTTRWRVQPVGFVQSHIALGDRGRGGSTSGFNRESIWTQAAHRGQAQSSEMFHRSSDAHSKELGRPA